MGGSLCHVSCSPIVAVVPMGFRAKCREVFYTVITGKQELMEM